MRSFNRPSHLMPIVALALFGCTPDYDLEKTNDGVDEIDENPSPEKIRKFLAADSCPFCGRGPYKVVAGHVLRTHGVSARELRDLAEIKWSESICSTEHAEKMRVLAKENDRVESMRGKQRSGRSNPVSAAGRKSMIQAAKSIGERRRVVPTDAYGEIRRRYMSGESAASIGKDFGVGGSRITQIAKHGR